MLGEQDESVQSALHHPRRNDSERSQNAPPLAISEGFFNHSQNMIVSGGNFNYIQSNNSGFQRIEKAAVSAAMHTSGEEFQRPGCYENTRVAVLERLRNWGVAGKAEEDADERVMWLYGDAGAGKSAIAQTLAVECAKINRLLGSFFFFRNDPDRADYSRLVATLAYQAVTVIPTLKAHVAAIVEQDPKIFEKDLELQFQSLLIDPLNSLVRRAGFSLSSIPRFIIIDGLDECSTSDKQSHLLKILVRVLQKCIIPLKVLIASRPEIEIKAAFNSAPLTSLATRLALDNSFKPDADIRHFLRGTFQTIKETHPFKNGIPASWPSEQDLEILVHKSSGQFIYAAITAKFVSSMRHKPVQRLGIILGLHPIESERDYPFAELDALYTYLFSAIPAEKLEIARKILGLLIVVHPLKPSYLLLLEQRITDNTKNICEFLSLEPGDEQYYLADLASVLQFEPYEDGGETETQIQITHASLGDFLLDSKRSQNFFISPSAFSTDILHICFRHLKDLTLNDRLLYKCFTSIPTLLSRANFTPGLRKDLALFSLLPSSRFIITAYHFYFPRMCLHVAMGLVYVVRELVSLYISNSILIFCSTILPYARKPDSGMLLSQYQHGFDCLLQDFLEKCQCDHILLSTTLIDIQWPLSFRQLVIDKGGVTFFGACACCNVADLAYLSRCCINTEIYSRRAWALHEFFRNPWRGGQYALNGKRYATAVIACLNRASIVPALSDSELMHLSNLDYEIATSKAALFAVPHLLMRAAPSHELVSLVSLHGFEQKYHWITLPKYESSQGGEVTPEELVTNLVLASRDYLKRSCDTRTNIKEVL